MTTFFAHCPCHCSNLPNIVLSRCAKSSSVMPPSVLYQPGESREGRLRLYGGRMGERDGEGGRDGRLHDEEVRAVEGRGRWRVVRDEACRSGRREMLAAVRPLRMRDVVFIVYVSSQSCARRLMLVDLD